MKYECSKIEMDFAGDVYAILLDRRAIDTSPEADKETFLLVRSSLPELKDRKLRWVIYLTDKKGNVLSDASAPFGFARSNDVIKELLDLLTGNAKQDIGVDFSDIFNSIYQDIVRRKIATGH